MPSKPLDAALPADDELDEAAVARKLFFCWITVRKFFGMSSGLWMRLKSTDWSCRVRTEDLFGSKPPMSRFSRGLINGSVLAPIPTELAVKSAMFDTPGLLVETIAAETEEMPAPPPPTISFSPMRRLCIGGIGEASLVIATGTSIRLHRNRQQK